MADNDTTVRTQEYEENTTTTYNYQSAPVHYISDKTQAAATNDEALNSQNQPGATAFQYDNLSNAVLDIKESETATELRSELERLGTDFPQIRQTITREIERLESGGEPEYLELDNTHNIRLVRRVLIPVHKCPKFNFVGKLLGPGGKTLQTLIQLTKCRIYVLGRGSSRDKSREEELLATGDPKFTHLKDPLHVRIEVIAPPYIAFQRLACALSELTYYLQPVKDEIVLQQMAELGYSDMRSGMGRGRAGSSAITAARGRMGPMNRRAMPRGRMGAPMTMPPHMSGPLTPGQHYTAYSGYDYSSYSAATTPGMESSATAGGYTMTPTATSTTVPPTSVSGTTTGTESYTTEYGYGYGYQSAPQYETPTQGGSVGRGTHSMRSRGARARHIVVTVFEKREVFGPCLWSTHGEKSGKTVGEMMMVGNCARLRIYVPLETQLCENLHKNQRLRLLHGAAV
ncbi:KH domain-containing, RNA-binding, signal transduction-associated protein 2 [Trichinella nelsoni]|uniref:KH domain-containing, RNA-binding, signal transduction-associated protein 2 n=1 Tax=Trichinella nelsoni TaxID=6336 RepID=A0A0V0RII0_9BILA|nr:KH domain-containing, RNA-binding, signal transduction-associated protein 2 [Trichinella nelsoni]